MSFFNVYLPIAGIHLNILLLIAIGFCVGIMGGFFGLGLGFITNTALNIFRFHMAFAIGTGLSNVFGQSLSAIRKHQKMGNVDWKLGAIAIFTSVAGFEVGSRVVIALEKAGDVGSVIRWSYVVVLAGLGSFMCYDYFVLQARQLKRPEADSPAGNYGSGQERQHSSVARRLHQINIPPMISFPASQIERVSLWVVVSVFLCTGFLSGVLGIGGGFMILPALVYLIGLPTTIAVGTSLITVLATAGFGCLTYALDGKVELLAAVFLLVGSSIGAQIGATAVKFIKGYGIRLLFAIMMILAALSVMAEQFYMMTSRPAFHAFSWVILEGTVLALTATIIARLLLGYRAERAGRI